MAAGRGTTEETLESRLRGHVHRLAGDIGERHVWRREALQAAASYIENEWGAQGYAVARIAYTVAGLPCANLEAVRRGGAREREILLVGAHYDTVAGSPGANDNGSGVAALLELSRMFAGLDPAMTVRFVAFVNEEAPFFRSRLQGSAVYAEETRRRGDDIRLMVCLETIGWYSEALGSQGYPPLFGLFHPDRANFIGLVSNFRSRAAMRRLAAAFRAQSDFPLETTATFAFVPGVSWSDHRSFWRKGYPAVMVTDTAFYRYRYYHDADDTPEKLCYPEFARMTEGLFRALATLAREGI
ncbi:M28 family peptidase [Chelatococcus sp. SYSU_G07232]|uniref:M28 family peptidase n=1 Tax=Chelatococcus albus TaxID=3047466 RepID=A0ABT7AB97_9HYPH|nr:M28 family peptidase [Chelatococcus sp. SYSU_G07232]MDJ1156642.1 M28 family peptidase [Chelatococcus sp. SYSU_G07232]